MNQPLATIVIIAYNEEKHIRDAIDSALAQTYEAVEVILVDDGSRDETLRIAREFEPRIRVIAQANSGNCSCPRNTGLANARGRYVSFLDGDDILTPDKIETQIALFEQFPDAGMAVGNYRNFGGQSDGRDHFATCPTLSRLLADTEQGHYRFAAGEAAELLLDENFTIASSPLFDTEKVRSLGGFCEALFSCEDFHLNYRMASHWPVAVTRDVVFRRRMHASNMSSNQLKMSKYYFISRAMLALEEVESARKKRLRRELRGRYKNYLRNAVKARAWREAPHLLIGLTRLV